MLIQYFCTVILFCVNVPVLSEQITETLPNPSTAGNFLTIAFSFAIFCVPNESTIVTIELNASGIAATASATANKKASIAFPPLAMLAKNSTAHTIIIIIESFFPKLSKFCCKGVFFSCVFFNNCATFPISVSIPIFVTI